MQVNYATNRCKKVFDNRHHAVLGISPFNSYFSEQQIAYLYNWASLNFDSVQLYVPDEPTIFTLQALGYEDNKAKKKANRQCSYLKNKIFRALISSGVTERDCSSLLICHSDLKEKAEFKKRFDWCLQKYQTDAVFREGCMSSSKWVLSHQIPENQELTQSMIDTAVKYFLAELPMFLWSPEILNEPSTAFCYHQCPAFLRQLFNGICGDKIVSENQGFLIIEPK